MKTISIMKAQAIGDQVIEGATIHINTDIGEINDTKQWAKRLDAEAELLADTLESTLPGGLFDRMLGILWLRKASLFAVPFESRFPQSAE